MMTALQNFVRDHPWMTGLILSGVAFILNGIRRVKAIESRMSVEEKLELRLHRAAMALRKLGRAKRLLSRCTEIYVVAPREPVQELVRRLLIARSDARKSVSHLTAVLKKIANLGAPPSIMATLDRSITEARSIYETCQDLSRNYSVNKPAGGIKSHKQINQCWREAAVLIDQAQPVLKAWKAELTKAETNISGTMDSTIVRSGGVFRNPFKQETAVENAQTTSVIELRESKEDLQRVEVCITVIQQYLTILDTINEMEPRIIAMTLGKVLDEIDNCLVDARLPLPDSLVSGESPSEDESNVKKGLMQMIYDLFTRAEVSAWATVPASR